MMCEEVCEFDEIKNKLAEECKKNVVNLMKD